MSIFKVPQIQPNGRPVFDNTVTIKPATKKEQRRYRLSPANPGVSPWSETRRGFSGGKN